MRITKEESKRAVAFVAKAGGEVTALTEEGQVLFVQGLIAGRYDCAQWTEFLRDGAELEFKGAVTAIARGARLSRQRDKNADDMGANAEWKPQRLSDFERKMRADMAALQRRSTDAEKMLAAAQRLVNQKHEEPDVPVIEAVEPEPEAVSDPEPKADAVS